MSKSLSTYLDGLRFVSALWVFLAHLSRPEYSGEVISIIRGDGNRAVIVFFVLSGFVISYVSDTKEKTLRTYCIARFARLYSVIIPILIVMGILIYLLGTKDVLFLEQFEINLFDVLGEFASTMFFVNEIWFVSWSPEINGALWSLSYEFWFYMLFASIVYLKGRWRIAAMAFVVLFAGPKILILIVPWFMGVYGYRVVSNRNISFLVGLLIWCFSVVIIVVSYSQGMEMYLDNLVQSVIPDGIYWRLRNSQNFLSYIFFGFLWFMNIVGFSAMSYKIFIHRKIGAVVSSTANSTFSLYLLHSPLLYFIVNISNERFDTPISCGFVILLIVSMAYLFSLFTERRKMDVRVWLESLVLRLSKPIERFRRSRKPLTSPPRDSV